MVVVQAAGEGRTKLELSFLLTSIIDCFTGMSSHQASSSKPSDDHFVDEKPFGQFSGPTMSRVFHNSDGKADVLLQSSNGVHFAVRRALLEATSSKFEDMLALSQRPPKRFKHSIFDQSRSTPDPHSLPVVGMNADATALELFLRHLVPQAYLVNNNPPSFPDLETKKGQRLLIDVLEMAVKYETPSVLDMVARIHLVPVIDHCPLTGWYIACRFGRLESARRALRACGSSIVRKRLEGARVWDGATGRWVKDYRDVCLGDLTARELDRLRSSTIRSFCLVQAKVAASQNGAYTWTHAADEFEL